jgi:hypothetical protein
MSTTRVTSALDEATTELRSEAIRFSRYLVDCEPSEALIERYLLANTLLFQDRPTARDRTLLAFAHKHPWSIPLLDAGTALSRSAPRFRRKLLVMMAILETTPELIDHTAPIEHYIGPAQLALRLGRAGIVAALKLIAGVVLVHVVAKGRDGH